MDKRKEYRPRVKTNTKDSLGLMAFLERYPNQWHGLAHNVRTKRAACRLQELYGSRVFEYDGFTNQMRFVPGELFRSI